MAVAGLDPISETYIDTEKLIRSTCYQFRAKYGADDIDDLMGDARVIFLKAYRSYDFANKGGAKFSTWLRFKVWYGLLSIKRVKAHKVAKYPTEPLKDRDFADRAPSYLKDMLERVSDDAATVIGLIMDGPSDIEMLIRDRGRNTPANTLAAVRQFLSESGWPAGYIERVFAEIRGALA